MLRFNYLEIIMLDEKKKIRGKDVISFAESIAVVGAGGERSYTWL